jgi:SAM-dependent methyltransferase
MVEVFTGDLMAGYPDIQSDRYDIVVCEQVLEHLSDIETPIRTLARVMKPGGTLFLGVPTFPHGLHYLREFGQKPWDRVFPPGKVRGHIQTFTKPKLLGLVRELTNLEVKEVRGFRIASGGLLRPLERQEWAWRVNRWLGRAVPGLCVEIQAIFTKTVSGSGR